MKGPITPLELKLVEAVDLEYEASPARRRRAISVPGEGPSVVFVFATHVSDPHAELNVVAEALELEGLDVVEGIAVLRPDRPGDHGWGLVVVDDIASAAQIEARYLQVIEEQGIAS